MKYKFSLLATLITAVTVLFTACVKKADTFTDFTTVKDLVIIPNSGLANFGAASVVFTPATGDTIRYDVYVNLASINKSGTDIPVTIGIDDAKRTAYNTENGTDYLAFTSDMYTLGATSLTIKAGERVAKTTLEIFAGTYDVTKSYMLPISITDASGKQLSSNLNTTYYHLIGNLLAGSYTWNFTRWSTPDSTTTPDGQTFTGRSTVFLPVDDRTIEVASGYFIGPRYVLSFDNNNGVLSNFKVELHPDDVAVMTDNGVTVTNGPVILIADPVNKHFRFYYTTLTRAVIDEYYQ